jgi:hypothetical protein
MAWKYYCKKHKKTSRGKMLPGLCDACKDEGAYDFITHRSKRAIKCLGDDLVYKENAGSTESTLHFNDKNHVGAI